MRVTTSGAAMSLAGGSKISVSLLAAFLVTNFQSQFSGSISLVNQAWIFPGIFSFVAHEVSCCFKSSNVRTLRGICTVSLAVASAFLGAGAFALNLLLVFGLRLCLVYIMDI